jgi:hypothetical protein
MRQTFARVGELLEKLATRNKIEPLGFQKVRPESGKLGIIGLEHFILPSSDAPPSSLLDPKRVHYVKLRKKKELGAAPTFQH